MTKYDKKKQGEKARTKKVHQTVINIADTDTEDEQFSPSPTTSPPKKRDHLKKKINTTSLQIRPKARKANNNAQTEAIQLAEQLLKLVNETIEAFHQIDIKGFLKSHRLEGASTVENLRSQCDALASLLQPRKVQTRDAPSTIQHYTNFFFHRTSGKLFYLLHPFAVFKVYSNAYINSKVFGYVVDTDNPLPLTCAFSGWVPAAEDHPMLLDSEIWKEEVMKWGLFHNHSFTQHRYDRHHEKQLGSAFASHVEPKLMLWYACYQLRKNHLHNEDPNLQIGELWRLHRVEKVMEAEIMISKEPCKDCDAFKAKMEDYTGIKFTITTLPNLGQLKSTKNGLGSKTLLTDFIPYDEVEEDDDDEEEESFQGLGQDFDMRKKQAPQVILRGHQRLPRASVPSKSSRDEEKSDLMVRTTSRTSSSMSSKKKIQSWAYKETRKTKSPKARVDADGDTDYNPFASAYPTPEKENYYCAETLEIVDRMKERKRTADLLDSPSASKSRRHKHST